MFMDILVGFMVFLFTAINLAAFVAQPWFTLNISIDPMLELTSVNESY